MKKTIAFFPIFFLLAAAALAQRVIESSARPASPRAGRVIDLREVARISDQTGKFFFRETWDIKAGNDGSLFVLEPSALYEFDPAGKFVRNHYRKGEGPGEFSAGITDFFLGNGEIVLFSSNVRKIVRLKRDGTRIEDIRPTGFSATGLLGIHEGRSFVLAREPGKYERKTGVFKDPLTIRVVDSQGRETGPGRIPMVFPFTVAFHVSGRGSSSIGISRLLTAADAGRTRFVYLSHSPEYSVKRLDLEKPEDVVEIKHPYKRVPMKLSREVPYPVPEYHNDICRLLVHEGRLWVVTSTIDKTKGILVDVFDEAGRYEDAFYLPLKGILTKDRFTDYVLLAISGSLLYAVEVDEEGTLSIAKYAFSD
jgi:hypothetical protein